MRVLLIICAMLFVACTKSEVVVNHGVSPDLLSPCPGWRGGEVWTERDVIEVLLAERRGRICANTKIETIDRTLNEE